MSKELYIAEVERRMTDLDEDYDTASNRAYDSMRERMFDAADNARKAAKERNAEVTEPLRSIINGVSK